MDLQMIKDSMLNQKAEHFTGIGLKNVQQRIQLNYGSVYGLEFSRIEGSGTRVTLKLPILENKHQAAGKEV
jgi:two-component system sensor histidine kinase YesM